MLYGKQADSVWHWEEQRWIEGEGKATGTGGNNEIERKDNRGLESSVRKTRAHAPGGESPLPLLSFWAEKAWAEPQETLRMLIALTENVSHRPPA